MHPSASPKPAKTVPDENSRELVKRLYGAVNRWDGSTPQTEFLRLLSPEFAYHQSNLAVGERGPEFGVTTRGLTDYLHTLFRLKQAVPNLYITLEAAKRAGEDLTEDRVTLRGTYFRRNGEATAVRNIQVPMKHLWRSEGGQLAECWAAEDGLGSVFSEARGGNKSHTGIGVAEPFGDHSAAYWLEHRD